MLEFTLKFAHLKYYINILYIYCLEAISHGKTIVLFCDTNNDYRNSGHK